MKKVIIFGLTTMLILGALGGSYAPSAYASERSSLEDRESVVPTENLLNNDASESVLEVAPYVHKNEEGLFYVDKNIPTDIYIENDVESLEIYLEEINTQVKNGEVTINDDLSITSNMMTTFASKGYTSKKYWWGERATYNNAQAKSAIKSVHSAAVDTGFLTAGLIVIPTFAAVTGLTSAYLFKLEKDMAHANKGKGIIVDMHWVMTYKVKSR